MSFICSTGSPRLIFKRLPHFINKHVRKECVHIPKDNKVMVDALMTTKKYRAKYKRKFQACVLANGFRDLAGEGIYRDPQLKVTPQE